MKLLVFGHGREGKEMLNWFHCFLSNDLPSLLSWRVAQILSIYSAEVKDLTVSFSAWAWQGQKLV